MMGMGGYHPPPFFWIRKMRACCLFLILILPAMTMSGCGKSDRELLEEAQNENRVLQSQLEQTHQKLLTAQLTLSNLQSQTRELKTEFYRLEDDDWRDVIPDLYDRTKTIDAAVSDLQSQVASATVEAQ